LTQLLTTGEKLVLLKASPIFRDVPLRDLRAVSEHVELLRYEAGEPVFRKGDPPEFLYVVNTGRVAIEQRKAPPLQIAELGRGEVFGEMALLSREKHRRSAVAVTAATVLAFEGETFLRLASRHPEILIGLSRVLAERLDHADRWLQRS
jgi:CRP-like cAMP-binding protein